MRADVLSVTTKGKSGASYPDGLAIASDTFLFSTANKLSDGMEFRIYNCSDHEASGVITLPLGAQTAALTEIDGRVIRELSVTNGSFCLTLGKWKIATLKVTFTPSSSAGK